MSGCMFCMSKDSGLPATAFAEVLVLSILPNSIFRKVSGGGVGGKAQCCEGKERTTVLATWVRSDRCMYSGGVYPTLAIEQQWWNLKKLHTTIRAR